MTQAATINGVRVVVPGVYSTVEVEDNLANLTPGIRNVFLIGEASKGVPGNLLNLSGTFFEDYESLKEFYGSGPLVDAARMVFQRQASAAFSGTVGQIYTFKTNQSTLASRDLMLGAGIYGTLSAAEYGEDGNLISSQIQDATVEILPKFSASWVMVNESLIVKSRVSGGAELDASLAAQAEPSELVSSMNSLSGVSASGGAQLELIAPAQDGVDTLSLTVDGTYPSRVTVTCSTTFGGADLNNIQPGKVAYIPLASDLAGGSSENVGSYVIISKTSTTVVMDKISSSDGSGEIAHAQPINVAATLISGDQTDVATSEIMVHNPVSISVDASSAIGTGAGLEVYLANGDSALAQRFYSHSNLRNPVSSGAALVANVSLSVDAGSGTFEISGGAFKGLPKIGDVLWVKPDSVLAGATGQNIGSWIVTASGTRAITASKVEGAGVDVTSVALSGQEDPFSIQPAVASTSLGDKLHVSSAERQVRLLASRQTDGATFPGSSVGGRVVLELGYQGTTATLTITKSGRLQTSVTGGAGADLDLNLGRFTTMEDLLAFLNAQTGYAAKVSSNQLNSLNPREVLDQVQSVSIATGHSNNAHPGRIKADYNDFTNLIADNFGLVSFIENESALWYAGLPDVETTNTFLSGGSLGATTNADILSGLESSLKIDVSQVVPLFSRDAPEDIDDGLTDNNSTYTIEAVNSLVKSHVAEASTDEKRRHRFGIISFHGSFEDAQVEASRLSAERLQLFFQMVRSLNSDGDIQWFPPWMAACGAAAGRTQARLGTSLLRKSFQFSDIKHIGDESIFSDTLQQDFDPDVSVDLENAIEAGMAAFRAVTGSGIRLESPDLSTRSRRNDPKGWYFERINVQFVVDEVLKTARNTLDGFIGARTTDVTPSVVEKALTDILSSFVTSGALQAFSIDKVVSQGNSYAVTLSILPVEALEFITLDVNAQRSVG